MAQANYVPSAIVRLITGATSKQFNCSIRAAAVQDFERVA